MKHRLVIICLFILNYGFSQRYNFENYTLENGLPQSTIFDIFQDDRGVLWLGTSGGGLVQFDGLRFKVINKRDGLAGNLVRAINQDQNKNLWIGTDNGISIYDGRNITNLKLGHNQESKFVYKIFRDKLNNIWISYPGYGLLKYKGINDSIPLLINTESGLSSNFIFDIINFSEDELLLTTYGGGISILNTKNGKIKNITKEDGFPSSIIFCVEKDDKGNFWFGSNETIPFYIHESELKKTNFNPNFIKRIDGFPDKTVWDINFSKGTLYFATDKSGIIGITDDKLVAYNSENGLPSNQFLKTFTDNLGILWAGTNGNGLCKFNGTNFSHISINPSGNSDTQIFGLVQDNNKFIWAASRGSGLCKIEYKNGKATIVKTFTEKDGLPENFLTSLCLDKKGNLWVGTTNKGVAMFDGKNFKVITENDGLSSNKINSIFCDSQNRIWISTPNGVNKFENGSIGYSNESNGLMNNEVQFVTEDKLANIWIATYGGLALYNGTFQNFNEDNGLFDLHVNCVAANNSNEILIGTFGGGLYYSNSKMHGKHKFKQIAVDTTLTSNNVTGICFLNENELIVATDKGIDKIKLQYGEIIQHKSFNKTDGFVSIENNINSIIKTDDDLIWCGTIKGITLFNYKQYLTNKQAPKIHLVDIQLFYKGIDWQSRGYTNLKWNEYPEEFKLNYKENNLTFSFQAINLSNPYKVKYKYKLLGADNDWLPVNNLPIVSYPSLNPGEYRFMIRACNEDDVWSDVLTQKFSIKPPFYKSWWFILLMLIFVVIVVITYIKWRELELKKKNLVLEEIVTERTFEISEQKKEIEIKNKDITDSIIYARRIQEAILPPEEKIRTFLKDSFVVYKPKDIISGDFYYFNLLDKTGKLIQDESITPRYYVVAVADCTGHGVPGALMSMIGYNGLNYALSKSITSGEVLDNLSDFVEQSLAAHSTEVIKDGMDLSICVIDIETKTLSYSGANNPLYIIRKSENPHIEGSKTDSIIINNRLIYEIKADKQPVGSFENKKKFKTHKIELFKGDELVLFTDGFADQFGGPNGKKFKYSALKNLLLSNTNQTFNIQKEEIQKSFSEWKGTLEQVDDVCIIGLSPLLNI